MTEEFEIGASVRIISKHLVGVIESIDTSGGESVYVISNRLVGDDEIGERWKDVEAVRATADELELIHQDTA